MLCSMPQWVMLWRPVLVESASLFAADPSELANCSLDPLTLFEKHAFCHGHLFAAHSVNEFPPTGPKLDVVVLKEIRNEQVFATMA